MINDSELSRQAAAQFNADMEEFDFVLCFCPQCEEEYQLPEDTENCVICKNPLKTGEM